MAFPKGFLFGTANADHQVEAHVPGREDVWDLWERSQGLTPRGKATDFWNRYEEDIAAAAAMGCRLFRFSVSWARVEISDGEFDAGALEHYRQVADCIRGHGMKVMLTLHHFVWPVWLESDCGGMIDRRFPDLFARYAERVAEALGDRVDYWITFNEPSQLTFGYIKPWWQNRYYMPPGLPRGAEVEAEAKAVGKLVPNLFLAHARAREAIKGKCAGAMVGANPLVTGFPNWLQMLMDWGACHRGLAEALFKFTTGGALVAEKGKVDVVIAGVTAGDQTGYGFSDPYAHTGKAVLVRKDFEGEGASALAGKVVGVIAVGNQPQGWRRDLPASARKKVFANYGEARSALVAGGIDALYGDAFYLLPPEENSAEFRFLAERLSEEDYVVVAPHGNEQLLDRVNEAIARFREDKRGQVVVRKARRPVSLHEIFEAADSWIFRLAENRAIRRIRKRGMLRVGIRADTGNGLEMRLASSIAEELLGDANLVEMIPVEPAERFKVLHSKSSWLNWAWRFWGTTSLIANVNWWYLGMAGKLAEELCPKEAVGAQDFIGVDYYWGLPTLKLHRFRALEDAAHGRFLQAPVWPQGLYHALRRFHRWFPGLDLFVVENGSVPMADGMSRKEYLRRHLNEVGRALKKGVPVKGYNLWSITSNREWGHAFDPNTDFGLYFVDLDKDPELKRVATPEVEYYRETIARSRP